MSKTSDQPIRENANMKIFTYGTIVAALCMGLALPTVSMALTQEGVLHR